MWLKINNIFNIYTANRFKNVLQDFISILHSIIIKKLSVILQFIFLLE